VTVTDIRLWTDQLFRFTTSRDTSFRFESSQFVMLGLELNKRPLLRAYSIESASYKNHLEFLRI
jgi:ferredoxin/flavodoxin---NADP+ reductase